MKIIRNILVIVMMFGSFSCATHISKPSSSPQASKVKFGKYKRVEVKEVAIAAEFSQSRANKRALKKINELLLDKMENTFPNMTVIPAGEEFSKSKRKVLQISPVVKEIKFISGGVRFWVGAMAGSSAVLTQTEYRDSSTKKVIANPEFYQSASAFHGAATFGGADNQMLEDIASDIAQYTSYNK